MKKDLIILTHTPIDYDSRVIKQVKYFSKDFHIILFSRLQNKESLKMFEGFDVEVREIPILSTTKTSRRLLQSFLKERYQKTFKMTVKKYLRRKLHLNYPFTDMYYMLKPENMWCRKNILDTYEEDYSNIAAILVNDLVLIHVAGRLKLVFDSLDYNIPLICDLHEAHFDYKSGQDFNHHLSAQLMERNLKLADVICAPTERVLNCFLDLDINYKESIVPKVVYNTSSFEDLDPSKNDEKMVKLVHVGIAGRDRKLEKMITALTHLEDKYKLHFYLVTTNSPTAHIYIEELKEYAKEIGVDSRVFFETPVNPDELVSCLNKYDIGVFYLEPDENKKNFDYAAPNKLFQYVQARLAVVVSDIGEMGKIVRDYNVGTVSTFSEEDFAHKIAEANQSLDIYKNNANAAASELSAEKQWHDVLEYVKDINKEGER